MLTRIHLISLVSIREFRYSRAREDDKEYLGKQENIRDEKLP